MKPHRIRMTHNLLLNYGLYRKMEIYVSSLHYLPGSKNMQLRNDLWFFVCINVLEAMLCILNYTLLISLLTTS